MLPLLLFRVLFRAVDDVALGLGPDAARLSVGDV